MRSAQRGMIMDHIDCIHDGSDLGCVHLEDEFDVPDEMDLCPHGITFDEECEECEADSESCGWRDVFDAGGEQ